MKIIYTFNVAPITDKNYLLKKFEGKGGWTYTEIPEILPDKKAPFGWVKVRGSIDDYEFSNYRLMPFGNGQLFLPVRAGIRKKIKKEAGDWIRIILYKDDMPIEIPIEFLECLEQEPNAHKRFLKLTEGKQKELINWIFSAKTEETKAKRILEVMKVKQS